MKLTLGFSPCPNDTFMFEALVNRRIDTEGLAFDVILDDVESLNQRAREGQLDVTKLSYYAFSQLTDRYRLLTSGSALGFGCGPLLISKKPMTADELVGLPMAIPGDWTTAHFLLRFFLGNTIRVRPYVFSDIEEALLREEIPAGVIIHENRFTYAAKGLHLIQDLGAYWESQTGSPIPLGAIAVSHRVESDTAETLDRLVRKSVLYAMDHPHDSAEYVALHAQEMNPEVMKQHIDLYVNAYSVELGEVGEAAVLRLMKETGHSTGRNSIFAGRTVTP